MNNTVTQNGLEKLNLASNTFSIDCWQLREYLCKHQGDTDRLTDPPTLVTLHCITWPFLRISTFSFVVIAVSGGYTIFVLKGAHFLHCSSLCFPRFLFLLLFGLFPTVSFHPSVFFPHHQILLSWSGSPGYYLWKSVFFSYYLKWIWAHFILESKQVSPYGFPHATF